MKPAVLKVNHQGTWKLVGKVFPVVSLATGGDENICLHEESGNQEVYTLDSPGGVDVIVAEFLREQGVNSWHHWIKGGAVFVTTIDRIIDFGVRKTWGGRDRYFLPVEYWRKVSTPWYEIPWITKEIRVGQKILKAELDDMVLDIMPEVVEERQPVAMQDGLW